MTRLSFVKDLSAGLKGTEALVVVASHETFTNKTFPSIFDAELRSLAVRLGSDTKPGDNGATSATLTQTQPGKLIVGVLPSRCSRHNCPARPEAVQHVITSAYSPQKKNVLIVLILDDPEHAIPMLAAVARAFPIFSRKSEETRREARVRLLLINRAGETLRIPPRATEVMNSIREISALVDAPPSEMTPERLSAEARQMLRGLPHVSVREIVGSRLIRARLLGIHSVGRSATSEPRLLVASYAPPQARGPHIALVGKGITFDTGGLHIKARGSMETMKSDMAGAAAVLGAFRVLVKSASKRPISLVMCLAENAIGPSAFKPDDILTLHSGKTVEINNTDAEGRLLLADGVSFAVRALKSRIVIDAATLTGAQLIATGVHHAAVISNDETLEQLAIEAGRATGDLVHPLPFAPEFFEQEFKSPVADMRNSVKNRANAQTSCAAQFIYSHIADEDVRWCHVDLAGPAFKRDRGTGFGVALLSQMVDGLPTKR